MKIESSYILLLPLPACQHSWPTGPAFRKMGQRRKQILERQLRALQERIQANPRSRAATSTTDGRAAASTDGPAAASMDGRGERAVAGLDHTTEEVPNGTVAEDQHAGDGTVAEDEHAGDGTVAEAAEETAGDGTVDEETPGCGTTSREEDKWSSWGHWHPASWGWSSRAWDQQQAWSSSGWHSSSWGMATPPATQVESPRAKSTAKARLVNRVLDGHTEPPEVEEEDGVPSDRELEEPADSTSEQGGDEPAHDPPAQAMHCTLNADDRQRLVAAEAASDIPLRDRQRILNAFNRQKKHFPPEVLARYAAGKHSRAGDTITLLKEWAAGTLVGVDDPEATQRRALTHRREEEELKGWVNWNELLHLLGGTTSKAQARYCRKLWDLQKGKPERRHPDGATLGNQRQFHLATLDRALRRREDVTAVNMRGLIPNAAVLQQLLATLQAPGLPPAAPPQPLKEEGSASKKRRGSDGSPLPPGSSGDGAQDNEKPATRASLLDSLYKLIPRLGALGDKLPAEGDIAGDAIRGRLSPLRKDLVKARTDLEIEGSIAPSRLSEIKALVERANQLCVRTNKLLVQLDKF